jgi:hypothetical protein
MERSEWIELLVSKYSHKLESICDRIVSCKVTIDVPRGHRGKEIFQVRVDVSIPGSEIVVNGHNVITDANINRAIREAFDSAKRQLSDYMHIKRGAVKAHRTNELIADPDEDDYEASENIELEQTSA